MHFAPNHIQRESKNFKDDDTVSHEHVPDPTDED
jgi:hypothetical protein